jgi:hypothetical protein
MKKILILAALAVLSGCGSNVASSEDNNAHKDRKGWYDAELYGDVESMTVKTYKMNMKFGEETLGELESSHLYVFNSNGDVIKDQVTYYYSSGDPWGYVRLNVYNDERNLKEATTYNYEGEVTGKYIYEYDESGNCLACTYYNDDGELETKHIWTYNDEGKYIDRKDYDAKGNLVKQYVPEYDDKGNNVCECMYGADGELINKQLRKYDDKDRCVELKEIDMDVVESCEFTTGMEVQVAYWYKWGYDDSGNIIEGEDFAADGMVKGRFMNSYKDGKLAEVVEYDSLGAVTHKHFYIRDKHGNVIEKKDYEYKGPIEFPKTKVIYEIEYR